MAINASNIPTGGNNSNKTQQAPMEAGVYPARLVQVIDFGLQPQADFQGKARPPVNEIMLTYEFVDTFMVDEDGNELENKPRWLSETLPIHNLAQDKAKSTHRYKALDPEIKFKGDFGQLVGTPCNVTVVANPGKNKNAGKVYNNIASISSMRPRDAQRIPDLKNPPKVFDLENPSVEVLASLPQWVQDKIRSNLQFNGSKLQGLLDGVQEAPKEEVTEGHASDHSDDNNKDERPW